jgi:hypothetical protein
MSTLFFHFDGTDNSPNDTYAPEHSVSSITNVLKSHLLLGGRVKNHIDITPNRIAAFTTLASAPMAIDWNKKSTRRLPSNRAT